VQNGSYLFCPDGSHLAMYDDQVVYFSGLIDFLRTLPNDGQSSGRAHAGASA
jgi:proline iminopeptidase